ncbi:MAG TPA: hypothetical protein VFT98_06560 [Myxococcota bacterium]|nr:hypothetical protein [Myxococcota bacterium]
MSWGKRAGKLVLLLLLAELLFFFFVGLRLRKQIEREPELLGIQSPAEPTDLLG